MPHQFFDQTGTFAAKSVVTFRDVTQPSLDRLREKIAGKDPENFVQISLNQVIENCHTRRDDPDPEQLKAILVEFHGESLDALRAGEKVARMSLDADINSLGVVRQYWPEFRTPIRRLVATLLPQLRPLKGSPSSCSGCGAYSADPEEGCRARRCRLPLPRMRLGPVECPLPVSR
jgi:hypothetical protein